jgi:hypothetical protein
MEEYKTKWGMWNLEELPKMDRTTFCGDYTHCDVPRDQFPKESWQADSKFLTKFLKEADKLVDRARNAILAEYGKSPEETEMFDLTYRDDLGRRQLKGPPHNGGWTTKRSMRGLSRRLLHAIMTRDTFTFIMGGHSAAAGHGNHFKQSYMMQAHKVLEPVFSYLGVELISRNLAQGGLGTIHSALGAADIYGDEIDFIIWDSGMTEGRDGKAVDMFGRQALLGNRAPVIWNLNQDLLELYHEHCDADVGSLGTGELGIPVTLDEKHADTLPYAIQYYTCDSEYGDMCREHKYMANCWVERDDVSPPKKQKDKPDGQASWHPGFRWHQLVGRILAYTILNGLKEAIGTWKDSMELPDDAWHVSSYYHNIRSKVLNLNETRGSCNQYNKILSDRVCKVQLRGRTEFTPRANPETTGIRSILKTGDYVPSIGAEPLYEGPDVRNPMFDIPEGHVDVLAILNNGRNFPQDDQRSRKLEISDKIVPGKGYQLDHPVGYCDGSYNAICGRSPDSDCLLYGHHDGRGGLRFHEYSGWIVMNVPKVKEGLVMIKMETWHFADEVPVAKGWKTVNNERHLRMHTTEETAISHSRELKREPLPFCDEFHFDFAIDGNITSWNLEQFMEARQEIQRVVEVYTLLDDVSYIEEGEEKDIEVAIRMHGCGNDKVFSLTHVYWA